MAFVQVQTQNNNTTAAAATGVTSLSCSFTKQATVSGNLIVLCTSDFSATPANRVISTITDTGTTNTFTKTAVTVDPDTTTTIALHYAKNIVGHALAYSVTVSPTGTCDLSICMAEYSGGDTTAPFHLSNTNTGTSTAPSSGAISPAGSDLCVGCVVAAGVSATGGGFTRFGFDTATQTIDAADKLNATGSQTASWTSSNVTWAAFIASFLAAAGGPTVAQEAPCFDQAAINGAMTGLAWR